MKIAIIGMGYVGLPLSLQFARSGVTVLGLDIDPAKVAELNAGRSYIRHIESSSIVALVSNGRFSASTDFSRIREVEAVIICVPTPLGKNREPDISYILRTGETIAPHLQKGTLVSLESTTYPGTTDEDLRAVLEKGSGLRAGVDFHLVFSPEREDPGNAESRIADIPKVIGGFTPTCLEKGIALYGKAVKKIIPVSSCRVAEATKLLENIFRSVNIALVNELKLVYGAMGIDIWEIISAAKTKPFGFMPFYPGPGLGGHCIPIDPFYLSWKARQCGKETRFIELAGEINTAMPEYVVARVAAALAAKQNTLSASTGERAGVRCRENSLHSPLSTLHSSLSPDFCPPASEPSVPGPEGAQPSTSPLPLCPSPPPSSSSSLPLASLLHARVLVLGLAYKPNVDDDRESPSYVLMNLLKERGADVAYYDPFVPVIKPSREHSHWAGTRSVSWDQPTISSFDAVLISTAHACVDYRQLADWSPCIIDTRNAMAVIPTKPGQVFKA